MNRNFSWSIIGQFLVYFLLIFSSNSGLAQYDLALDKNLTSTGPYSPGDLVTFQIIVENQGSIDGNNIFIEDITPDGLLYQGLSTDPNLVDNGGGSFTILNVPASGSGVSMELTYQIDPSYTGSTIINTAEIVADDGDDIDSNPDTDITVDEDSDGNGDDDDEDQVSLPVLQVGSDVYDLALTKTVTTAGPYMPGDFLTYEIFVENQGSLDGANIAVEDISPAGLIYQGLTSNANVVDNGGGSFTVLNVVAGSGTSMELSYQIDPNFTGNSITNNAEIVGDDGDDIDSDPSTGTSIDEDGDGNGDDDDEDWATINLGILQELDLALTKSFSSYDDLNADGVLSAGDDVTFTINVINQGWIDVTDIEITDYIPAGTTLSLNDTNGWLEVGSIATNTIAAIPLSDPISSIDIVLSINPDFTGTTIVNWAEISEDNDDDFDSVADSVNDDPYGGTDIIDGTGGDEDDHDDAEIMLAPVFASLGNLVWEDLNGNGIQDGGESGVEGIQVILRNENGVAVSVQYTDANGMYLFENLIPGAYYVEFNLPFGYSVTLPNMDSNNTTDSDVDNSNGSNTTPLTNLSAGETDLNWDAGIHFCVPIGDLVWMDLNENDTHEAEENGINGMRVNLFRQMTNGQFILWDYEHTGPNTDSPSDDGYFKFCAPPGTYYLEFVDPPLGLVNAMPSVGSEETDSDVTGANGPGTTDSFTVLSGDEFCNIGAGYYAMGSIGDFVFIDDNQNGLRDPNESGLANVYIQAYNQNGDMVGEALTASDGSYVMDYLQQTDVYLKFLPPTGYAATMPHLGPESIDSDIDNSNGPMTTQYYNIQSGHHVENVDAGLVFGVVPVEWTDFFGENRDTHHWLQWDLAMELNVSHYEVERSVNSTANFESIGKVLSLGTSSNPVSYNLEDYDVAEAGTYYYRIKQIDISGNHDYSKTIVLETRIDKFIPARAIVYPNPSIGVFTLDVDIYEDGADVQYMIFDNTGKLAVAQTSLAKQVDQGQHSFGLDERQLTPGVYTIRLNVGSTIVKKKLIIVSN